jgi:thiol:disulfide interchange protein
MNLLLRLLRYILAFLCVLTGIPALASSQLDLPLYSTVYDVDRNPNADGRAALKLAKDTQRKVLIEVGGDWCSWCHILDRFIKDHPDVETRLHKTFVVLKVNVSDVNDNAEFMASLPPALGYPHMYITDNNGDVLHSQDTAEFLVNKKYSESRFMVFLDRWKSADE